MLYTWFYIFVVFFQYLAYDDEQWTQVKSHACTNDQNDKKKEEVKKTTISKNQDKKKENTKMKDKNV